MVKNPSISLDRTDETRKQNQLFLENQQKYIHGGHGFKQKKSKASIILTQAQVILTCNSSPYGITSEKSCKIFLPLPIMPDTLSENFKKR